MKTTHTKYLLLLILIGILSTSAYAQNPIKEVELQMDGVIFPRMSDTDKGMINPVLGQCIYNTDTKRLECYDGNNWKSGRDGTNCWDLNSNGIADANEDVNGSGTIDVLDCKGMDGQNGAPGQNGVDGQDGAPGQNGVDGQDGAPGQNGLNGQNGADGQSGINCWDLDGDGINDPNEDINDDQLFNAQDCHGLKYLGQGNTYPSSPEDGDVFVLLKSQSNGHSCDYIEMRLGMLWVRIGESNCST